MPVITVDWWKGNDRGRRADLVHELTSTVSRIADCPKEAVTVIVRDVEADYWGKGGVLADTLLAGGGESHPEPPGEEATAPESTTVPTSEAGRR